jgi:hypothetical protein
MTEPEEPPEKRSQLAALIGEAIAQHAPHTAKENAEASTKATNDWLEELEAHYSELIAPLLGRVFEGTNPPPEVKALVDAAAKPTAQFGAVLQTIFVYGIVSQIVGASVTPFLQVVNNEIWSFAVSQGAHVPLPPADIATSVARGLVYGGPPTTTVPPWAYERAAESGVNADDLNIMASIVGLPPSPQELFELLRRGIIDEGEAEQGLREGDLRDEWIKRLVQLRYGWLTPTDFIAAAVRLQMEPGAAEEWAKKVGLDTDTSIPIDVGSENVKANMFGLAFNIAGRPPGPEEAGRAANRGIIPWKGTGADALTFEQSIAESDVKTKWTPILEKLAVYVPPPRTVGALLEHGAITYAQAVQYWEDGGVPEALAHGYAYEAEQQHIGQDKLLAIGEVKTGYYDGLIPRAKANELLEELGQRDGVAAQVLDLIDFRREIASINSMVTKVRTLYVSWRLSAVDALASLEQLGVASDIAHNLLSIWDVVRDKPIRLPSAEEIAKAVKYETLTAEQALTELAKLGYEPRDAAIVLSAYGELKVEPLPPLGAGVGG